MIGDDANSTPLDARVLQLVLADRIPEASDIVLARLSPELRPFLHRLLGELTLVDEAHAATCDRLSKELRSFRWDCSLRSWIFIVATREARRCRLRHPQGRRAAKSSTTVSPVDGATWTHSPTVRQDIVEALRESLSEEDRDLLVLRVERGLAWREIAAAFLDDEAADRDIIARGAARLQQRYRSIRDDLKSALAKRDAAGLPPEGR